MSHMLNNWQDKYIKLTKDNAKDFFFDMKCEFLNFRERLDEFKALHIEQAEIKAWTDAYFRLEFPFYQTLSDADKFNYISHAILNFGDQLQIDLIKNYYEDYKKITSNSVFVKKHLTQMIYLMTSCYMGVGRSATGFLLVLSNYGQKDMVIECLDHILTQMKDSQYVFETRDAYWNCYSMIELVAKQNDIEIKHRIANTLVSPGYPESAFYWYDPKVEITLENAKTFFWNMKCSGQIMEFRYNDFDKLSISEETLVAWTTEYFTLMLHHYEELNHIAKYRYLKYNLANYADRLSKELLIKYFRDYQAVLCYPEILSDKIEYTIEPFFIYSINLNNFFSGIINRLLTVGAKDEMYEAIKTLVDLIKVHKHRFEKSETYIECYLFLKRFGEFNQIDIKPYIKDIKDKDGFKRGVYDWYDEDVELTYDNVKEFFFDMNCNMDAMGPKYQAFLDLNIEPDIISKWINEYYELDLDAYENMMPFVKPVYIFNNILALSDVLDLKLVEIYKKDFVTFIQEERKPEGYLEAFIKMNENQSFKGFLPAYLRLNQHDTLYVLINLVIDIIKKHEISANNPDAYVKYNSALKAFIKENHLDLSRIKDKTAL